VAAVVLLGGRGKGGGVGREFRLFEFVGLLW
jgi:hypothetical protein